MAKTAKDYKITGGYGCQKGYPLNKGLCKPGFGFHKGEDRAMPIGVDVVVNGVKIGDSGNTGLSTGPHLHVGKWAGGTVKDPNGKGFDFKKARVQSVGYNDPVLGNYVRIDADGYRWIYLHLSKVTCKVGQSLKVKAPLPIPIVRKFYIVKSGDTVDYISKKFKLKIDPKKTGNARYPGFMKLNPNVKNVNWIYVGQKVRVK